MSACCLYSPAGAGIEFDDMASSCTGRVHMCHPKATCTNTPGSYTCTCNTGFRGQGSCCGISSNSECGTPGTALYISECYDNHDGCIDINECQEDTHRCSLQAECINTYGSYQCDCQFGLLGSGLACYKAGYYETSRDLWRLMGQDGKAANIRGLIQFNTWDNKFVPFEAGFASWIFSQHTSPPAVHRASYGLPTSMDELLTCSNCLEMSTVVQRQCGLGVAMGSPDCPEAQGFIHLGGMALTENVKCSWEFLSMQFVEFHVTEFRPIASGDTVELCYDSYTLFHETQKRYKICNNFSSPSNLPPTAFYSRAPCKVTLYAVSAYDDRSMVQTRWASLNPSASRFNLFYRARTRDRVSDEASRIEDYTKLPKFEMNPHAPSNTAVISPYLRVSISNMRGLDSHMPCSLNHRTYSDFSSIALQQHVIHESPALKGSWKGECRSETFRNKKCSVDVLFFGVSSMQIIFTGCEQDDIQMPMVQTAVVSFPDLQDRESRQFLDQNVQWLYRRLHLTWTSPSRSAPGSQSKASIAWPRMVNFEDMSQDVLLHILPSGKTTPLGFAYPGSYPELLDDQQDSCAVLRLNRLDSSATMLPQKQAPVMTRFVAYKNKFELYDQCNSLVLRNMPTVDSDSGCSQLRNLLHPQEGVLLELSADSCQHECVLAFQSDLAEALKVCKVSWKAFLQVAEDTDKFTVDNDDYIRELQRLFIARLGFLGDLLMNIQLGCNFNLNQFSCIQVNQRIVSNLAHTCPSYHYPDVRLGSFAFVLPEYIMADGDSEMCNSCKNRMTDILRDGHCCISTAFALKRRLLDLFLPGPAPSLTFDLSDYLCRVHSRCDSVSANLVTLSKQAVEPCDGGQRRHHLECLLSSCSLGYAWPVACCQQHVCENGGNR